MFSDCKVRWTEYHHDGSPSCNNKSAVMSTYAEARNDVFELDGICDAMALWLDAARLYQELQ